MVINKVMYAILKIEDTKKDKIKSMIWPASMYSRRLFKYTLL